MSCNLEQQSLSDLADKFIACPDFSLDEKRIFAYLLSKVSNLAAGLVTEKWNSLSITYHGSTNNIDTVEYSLDGTIVATVTITYVGGVPSADDALIATVTKS
jgi:hypothetical protein